MQSYKLYKTYNRENIPAELREFLHLEMNFFHMTDCPLSQWLHSDGCTLGETIIIY